MTDTADTADVEAAEFLSKDIDYLGNLGHILRDLAGYRCLAFELIQNADDAKATALRFTVESEGLTVWNDGEFTDCGRQDGVPPDACPWKLDGEPRCDFHNFRLVAGQGKQDRDDTTGAFGIGFTAVYQITDRPELISSGRHWMLDETAESSRRIASCRGCDRCRDATGTTLWLPFARDPDSDFREKTNSEAVTDDDVHELGIALIDASPTALLFLRTLTAISVEAAGSTLEASCDRTDAAREVAINGAVERWHVVTAEFDGEAARLRSAHPNKIEEKRSTRVAVAFPTFADPAPGRFCAYLPTDRPTHTPFLINADFFPTSDRKDLVVEGYRAEWNQAAVECAAQLIAEELEAARDALGAQPLWAMVRAAADGKDDPEPLEWLSTLWEALKAELSTAEVVPCLDGGWARPQEAWYPMGDVERPALGLLSELGLSLMEGALALELVSFPRTEVKIRNLSLRPVVEVLEAAGLNEDELEVKDLPACLQQEGALASLRIELDLLAGRSQKEAEDLKSEIRSLTVLPCVHGHVTNLETAYVASAETAELFAPLLDDLHFVCDDLLAATPALAKVSDHFDAADVIEHFTSAADGELKPEVARSLRLWLASQPARELEDATMRSGIKALPIFPTADGLHPLDELALPGDFEDPLGLANILDVSQLGKERSFVETTLGVESLTLDHYITEVLPRAFEEEPDARVIRKLVAELAKRLGQFSDDDAAKRVLCRLPLVETTDGEFAIAAECYFALPEVELLQVPVLIAKDPATAKTAIRRLYELLGVRSRPSLDDLFADIQVTTQNAATPEAKEHIRDLIDHLQTRLTDDISLDQLTTLRASTWLPEVGSTTWRSASQVKSSFRDYLFKSTGQFIDLPRSQESRCQRLLEGLGVTEQPSTEQVVRHILRCVQEGKAVNRQVYVELDRRIDEAVLSDLLLKPCLLDESDPIEVGYLAPYKVFLGPHEFGRFRHQLGRSYASLEKLMEELEVREVPAADDAVEVLLEIAAATPTNPDEEAGAVAWHCWQMITAALQSGEDLDLSDLKAAAVVPGPDGTLLAPEHVLIDDLAGLSKHLHSDVLAVTIPRPEHGWRGLLEAGARNLSTVVVPEVVHFPEGNGITSSIEVLVRNRLDLLVRVFDDDIADARRVLNDALQGVEFFESSELTIQLLAPSLGTPPGEPLTVGALWKHDDRRFLSARGGSLADAARELVRCLLPAVAPQRFAGNVKIVLEEATAAAAAQVLTSLGVADLAIHEAGVAGTAVVDLTEGATHARDPRQDVDGVIPPDVPLDGPASEAAEEPERADPQAGGSAPGAGTEPAVHTEDIPGPGEAGRAGAGPWTGPRTGGGATGQGSSGGRAGDGHLSGGDGRGRAGSPGRAGRAVKGQRRTGHGIKQGRLVSYAVPKGDAREEQDFDKAESEETNRAGVDFVLEHERGEGRHPTEMDHANPGYDVESRSTPGGPVERYIEIKSTDGRWGERGVVVSRRQIDHAKEHGDTAWLYVVEFATTNPTLHKIQNPAERVSAFAFDSGWKGAAEGATDWEPSWEELDLLDDSARPLVVAAVKAGAPLPVVGLEVGNRWQVEAGWAERVAIVLCGEAERDAYLEAEGWVFDVVENWTVEDLLDALGPEEPSDESDEEPGEG